jgi:hypothetical protein
MRLLFVIKQQTPTKSENRPIFLAKSVPLANQAFLGLALLTQHLAPHTTDDILILDTDESKAAVSRCTWLVYRSCPEPFGQAR